MTTDLSPIGTAARASSKRTLQSSWPPPRPITELMKYMPQLDGLRGAAVLIVMTHHAYTFFGGYLGVQVFFVLSGYLITSLLMQEHRATGGVRLGRFYRRRLLRLYPPLLAAILVLLPLAIFATGLTTALFQSLIATTYTTNFYGLITGSRIGPWSHTWTLAVEEQFYLVWPLAFLLLFAVASAKRVALLVVLGTASLIFGVLGILPGNGTFNPLLTSGGLVIGCALALGKPAWTSVARLLSVGIIGLSLVVGAFALGSSTNAMNVWAGTIAVAGSAFLIAHLVTGQSILIRVLSIRPLAYVGKISYELYLWHYPLLILILQVWPNHYRPTVAIAYTGAFAAAVLSHRFVSRPLNRKFKPRLV